jgi:hypothetical protein
MLQTKHRISSHKECVDGSKNKYLERKVFERHRKIGGPVIGETEM